MSPSPRRRRRAPAPDPFPEHGLAELGLAPGDQVRFRRTDAERWKPATVARRERDGSVGLHDAKGASRSIPVSCIEVRDTGPRGGVVWEPLVERAARTEQMALVADRPPAAPRGRRGRPARPELGTDADPAGAAGRPADADQPADPSGPAEPAGPSASAEPDHPDEPDEPDDGQLRLL